MGDGGVAPQLDIRLRCSACGAATDRLSFGPCASCGEGALEAASRTKELAGGSVSLPSRPRSVWDFAALLPAVPPAHRITLGEGGTPLIEVRVGRHSVLVKHEGTNPTLSFKDRFSAVNVSVARALGYHGLVLASTGNAGLAAATYGARAGLAVRVICPPDTPMSIQRAIVAAGAELIVRRPADQAVLIEAGLAEGRFPGSRAYPFVGGTPFGAEGYKTIAYEIVADLGDAPAAVYVPLGGGDGLFGIAKGFRELRDLGLAGRMPRMIGVRTRVAWAISIARDEYGPHADAAIRESGGSVIEVGNAELALAMRALARAGVLAEPASAVSAAGYLAEAGTSPPADPAVCVVTSHLAKWWDHVERGVL